MSRYEELKREVENLVASARVVASSQSLRGAGRDSIMMRLDHVLDKIFDLNAKLTLIDIRPDYSQYETPAARATDPITSHEADEHIKRTGKAKRWRREVLAALGGFQGRTARELASESGIKHSIVHKRLPELRDQDLALNGPARHCHVTGRKAMTWYTTS